MYARANLILYSICLSVKHAVDFEMTTTHALILHLRSRLYAAIIHFALCNDNKLANDSCILRGADCLNLQLSHVNTGNYNAYVHVKASTKNRTANLTETKFNDTHI